VSKLLRLLVTAMHGRLTRALLLGNVIVSQRKPRGTKRKGPRFVHKTRRDRVRDAHGRVHLLVQQNADGSQQLQLASPVFEQRWQNELLLSTAGTAYQALSERLDEQRVVELTRHALDNTSRLADGLLQRVSNGKVACHSGCDHCCHQSVGVTPSEALVIRDYLQSTLSESQLTDLRQRLAQAVQSTRGLSTKQRYSPDHPCPFLEQRRCGIYPVRPLSCRGMNSLDADDCASSLRDPAKRAEFVDAGVGGKAFMEPIRAFHAVSGGLQLAFSELFNLEMRPLDLVRAVNALLSEPKLAQRWLSGEDSLEAARGGDSSGKQHADVLSGARRTQGAR